MRDGTTDAVVQHTATVCVLLERARAYLESKTDAGSGEARVAVEGASQLLPILVTYLQASDRNWGRLRSAIKEASK